MIKLNQLYILQLEKCFSYIHQSLQLIQFFSLKSLKDAFIREGHSSVDVHAQEDVVEILEILLEELTGPSIIITAVYNIKSLTSAIHHL